VAAFGVGTGKTLTAVVTSQCLLNAGIVSKVIVVTPKSLVENFKKEIDAYGADRSDSRYEFHTHSGLANTYPTPDKSSPGCDDALLIVDEAHELRTNISPKGGARAYAFVNCALRAKRVLLLTATPIYNRESDIVNLVSMVKGKVIKSLPKKTEDKTELLRNVFTFFNLPEGSSDIPSSNVNYQRLEMSPQYYRKYRDIEKKQDVDWKNPHVFLSGLRRATNAITPNPKADWTVDRIVSRGLKTVVFSSFISSGLKIIQEALDARGITYASVKGSLTADERKKAVAGYNRDEIRVLFISKAGGVGLDLKGTREVILLESSWSKAQEDQVIGRAIRIGSHAALPPAERHVEVHHLILMKPPAREENDSFGSADEILQDLVEEKKKLEDEAAQRAKYTAKLELKIVQENLNNKGLRQKVQLISECA
jgi:SNF2 family DNA or RNA helicase